MKTVFIQVHVFNKKLANKKASSKMAGILSKKLWCYD